MEKNRINDIQKLLPNFKIDNFKLLNIGANSEAFMVNNEFIFRFPLKKTVFEDYKVEKQILETLEPYIKSTKIPKTEIFDNDRISFSKHKIIEGIDFYKSKVDLSLKRKIAKQLAKFYVELHSVDTDNFDFLKDRGFHLEGYDISDKVNELKEILGDDFIEENISEKMDYLYETHNHFDEMDKVLCHGDIHEENIIINNGNLSGIIDFGNVFIGNRNVDFSSILEYDIDFGLSVIEEYEKSIKQNLNRKYILYLQQIRCYSNLLYFVANGDEKYTEMFKRYIKNLNRFSGNFYS